MLGIQVIRLNFLIAIRLVMYLNKIVTTLVAFNNNYYNLENGHPSVLFVFQLRLMSHVLIFSYKT